MHWTPLSGAPFEDVFGPTKRPPRPRNQLRRAGKRPRPTRPQVELLEVRDTPSVSLGLADSPGTQVTTGEVVRYRLEATIPADHNFYAGRLDVRAALPAGVSFLDDGTARMALVSDGGISSSLAPAGSALYARGSEANVASITPGFALPGSAVTTDAGGVTFHSQVRTVTDNDPDREFIVIEFNALVDDATAAPPASSFQLLVGGVPAGPGGAGKQVSAAEPTITGLTRTAQVSPDGASATYVVSFRNAAGPNAATAYNVRVLDPLPAGVTLDPASVRVVGGTGLTDRSSSSQLDLTLDAVAPGGAVTITYTAALDPAGATGVDASGAPLQAVAAPLAAGNNSLSGLVFGDTDHSGDFNAGDELLSGVPIDLVDEATGATVASTTTGADGSFQFTNVADGTYSVVETQQPAMWMDGLDFPGSAGGVADDIPGDTIRHVTLTGGVSATDYLFGECPCDVPANASLSGRVFCQDPDAIPGAVLRLTNLDTGETRQTVTDADGYFFFTDLPAGHYRLEELSVPATTTDVNGELEDITNIIDNRAGTVNGQTRGVASTTADVIDSITINDGEEAIDYFFAEECAPHEQPPAQLTGSVFCDENGNGLRDADEPGMAGVTVRLTNLDTGATVDAVTDANGVFSFSNLPAGRYRLTEVSSTLPATITHDDGTVNNVINAFHNTAGTVNGQTDGTAVAGQDVIDTITLSSGDSGINYFFGEDCVPQPQPAQLSGHVYFDHNCNCVFDTGDTPISGVTITLKDANGNVVGTTTTDANGFYSFTNLAPGSYRVEETQPPNLVDGCDHPGTTGGTVGPNQGIGTDFITAIPLAAGDNSQNNDFFECAPAQLSGHVYFDRNCNCVFDSGDMPIPGVTLTLRDASGNVVGTTTTDSNGFYSFTNLMPGTYRVEETQPAGYQDGCDHPGTTGGTVGPNQGIGTDFITGIPLAANDNSQNNDFFECAQATISGSVYCDDNGNGTRDSGELGIGGAVIRLTGGTLTAPVFQATDANGNFAFVGLAPGTYQLNEVSAPTRFNGLDVRDSTDQAGTVRGVTVGVAGTNVISGIGLQGGDDSINNLFGHICTAPAATGTLSGHVFCDLNDNGVFDSGETPIAGATVTLTGVDSSGATVVNRSITTNDRGEYNFTDLGTTGVTYTLRETQPPDTTDGKDHLGTAGGVLGNDVFSSIVLTDANPTGINYDFGEICPPGMNPGPIQLPISKLQFLASTPSSGGGEAFMGTVPQSPSFANANAASRTGVRYLATGTDAGGGPNVRVFDFISGREVFNFNAYDASFRGGVRVALGDVNGDGVPDIVTAPGAGGGPDVRVFSGTNGQMIREFMAYAPGFTGGVYVAVADVNGDGKADIITGAGEGGGADVRVFDGASGQQVAALMPYDPNFRGGVRVAAADFNRDGDADVVVAPGPGGGPDVQVFSGMTLNGSATPALLARFMAYDPGFTGGVYLAAGNQDRGDVNGDGVPDLVTGAGAGGTAHIKVFSGATFATLNSFLAFNTDFTGGVRVGLLDVNGDGRSDVVVGSGPGRGAFVRIVDMATTRDLEFFQAYNPAYLGGVFVAGA